MKNPLSRSVLIIVSTTLGLGQQCCRFQDAADLDLYERYRNEPYELRDSLYILHTIKELSNLNWYTFADYSLMYEMTNKEVQYSVLDIFYSPDKTKIVAWIVEKLPNARTSEIYNPDKDHVNKICPHGADTIYNMTALIGYRDTPESVWNLYPFNLQQVVCFSDLSVGISIMGQYYFSKMKDHEMIRVDQSSENRGMFILERHGYNLQDKDFWTKCWIWQRDTVGSTNLYPFQVKNYNGYQFCNKCAIPLDPPQIIYPNEIRDLFNL
jgi:hypothetical protein